MDYYPHEYISLSSVLRHWNKNSENNSHGFNIQNKIDACIYICFIETQLQHNIEALLLATFWNICNVDSSIALGAVELKYRQENKNHG